MKFVVHRHFTLPEHYDLMLESGDCLLTWRVGLEDLPLLLAGNEVRAERIQDHRAEYLDFEGPISCGRGMVSAFDRGECLYETRDAENIRARIQGTKMKGLLSIRETGGSCVIGLVPEDK